ncbi:MAG: GNAT family N-acetyltransferase [Pseudomonadota bacterium]
MPGTVLTAPGLRLRPTRPEDVPFVREAEGAPENRAFVEQWSDAEHLASLRCGDSRHLIIETQDGRRAGYVVLEGLQDPGRALLLRRIVVTRKGEGIGNRAVEAVERFCFETLGFRRLWLEVHEANPAARRVYAERGFGEEPAGPAAEGEPAMVRMAIDAEAWRGRAGG